MDTFEERLAFLEGRVDEHARGTNGLTDSVRHLDQKVDRFREELAARIDALDQKVDRRMDALDQKVDRFRSELSARIDGQTLRLDGLTSRIDSLDLKMGRQFAWTVGIQVSVLVAVIGALLVR